ncbi:hypothetical protein EQG49_10555 [Periweissella cryptocerci]|uniref:Uncharacterized protein n=1 Tax=Periweissella cryptocerci TaxID=2506420 RepID=A0A4P6YVP6_9LACO|nr:hypothetical protein [Periweissella cryptocerci]QBO36851.1 hypothetical protein EQG49_10555 [Periweissella cryptocerci]
MKKTLGLTDKEQEAAMLSAADVAGIPYTVESQGEFKIWVDKEENIYVEIKSAPTGFRADLLFGPASLALLKNNIEIPTEEDLLNFVKQLNTDDVQDFLLGYVMDVPRKDARTYLGTLNQKFNEFLVEA